MILPRLSGPHVPKFVAAGDFAGSPTSSWSASTARRCYARIADLPLPYEEVAEIGVKVATALDDLHRQHVIHLDVKPSNIMFRPTGEAVLLDFGLSHHDQLPDLMQEEFRLPFGTAPYMAPEQLLGVRERSAQRPVRAGRAAVLLHHRRAAVRRKRDAARHAPAAVARSGAAAPSCSRTIRPGCRKSCCVASRSSRPGATRRRRNWPSI